MAQPCGTAPARWERYTLACILGLFSAAVLYKDWTGGVTVDEPVHLVSAHVYWHGGKTLPPRDMPPLIRIAGGWLTWVFALPVPADLGKAGDTRNEWDVGLGMMERLHDDAPVRRLFFWARASLLAFPLALLALSWWWARQIFTPVPALLGTAALAMDPTFRAHSALYKNDVAAAFGYFLFWYAAWRFWKRPDWRTASFAGVAAGLALLAKLSMVILVPAALGIVLLRAITTPRPKWLTTTAAGALCMLLPWCMALIASPFEIGTLSDTNLAQIRDLEPQYPHVAPALAAAGNAFRYIPIALPMWDGAISLVLDNGGDGFVFLLGRIFTGGSPWYFLVALLVKLQVPVLILSFIGALALFAAALRHKGSWAVPVFVAVPPMLYVGLASLSSLQYGVRLVLPAIAFLSLLTASAASSLLRSRKPWLVTGLFAWMVIVSAAIFPDGIAFFNSASGGPKAALTYLSDSNVDWGQGLPELAQYARRSGIDKLKLCYFGMDNPYRYFREQDIDRVAPPWSDELTAGRTVLVPEPGMWAVSASLLSGQLFTPKYRDYFHAFRIGKPIATPGYSIYVYRIENR